MTCDMVRRKTKEKRGAFLICRACGNTLPRRHCGLKCRKCHAWACNAACAGDVADLHCCRMAGVASHESQSQSCSQGLGSCAAKGTPRLTQAMEQAMDVQMADVQMAGGGALVERAWVFSEAACASGASPPTCHAADTGLSVFPEMEEIVEVAEQFCGCACREAGGGCPCTSIEA